MKLINSCFQSLKFPRACLFLLPFLCLFGSCAKAPGEFPDSDYTFEVTCSSCTINIQNGNNVVSYNVYGFRSIPFNHALPIITVSLWTDYDYDDTVVKFKGSGYNTILFDGTLYYGDPAKVVEFNL